MRPFLDQACYWQTNILFFNLIKKMAYIGKNQIKILPSAGVYRDLRLVTGARREISLSPDPPRSRVSYSKRSPFALKEFGKIRWITRKSLIDCISRYIKRLPSILLPFPTILLFHATAGQPDCHQKVRPALSPPLILDFHSLLLRRPLVVSHLVFRPEFLKLYPKQEKISKRTNFEKDIFFVKQAKTIGQI